MIQLQAKTALILSTLIHVTLNASAQQQYRELKGENHVEYTNSVEITNLNNSRKLPKLRRQVESQDYFWAPIDDKIVGDASGAYFGSSIALSGNGRKVAITAPFYRDEKLRSHVKMYELDRGIWRQMGTNIPVITEFYDDIILDLSADGSRVVIGTYRSSDLDHFVRIYEWNVRKWEQVGNDLKGENNRRSYFGESVSISSNGTMVAIGAGREGPNFKGCAYVFYEENENWEQVGSKLCGSNENDYLGGQISLSDDGLTLAIGSSSLRDQLGFNSREPELGLVKVFGLEQQTNGDRDWVQVGSDISGDFKIHNQMSLSGDGKSLVQSGWGINGIESFFVRVYQRFDWDEGRRQGWAQWGNTIHMEDNIDGSIAVSNDGTRIIVSDSDARNLKYHVFQMTNGEWIQMGNDLYPDEDYDEVEWWSRGTTVSISGDGSTVAVGIGWADDIEEENYDAGLVRVFGMSNGTPSMSPTLVPTMVPTFSSTNNTSRTLTQYSTAIILGCCVGVFIIAGALVSFHLWRKQKKRLAPVDSVVAGVDFK